MGNETKVGLLVVVALAVLGWLSVQSGSFGLGHATTQMRPLSSLFSDVEGIKVGSVVKMAGVDIGEVTGIELQPNGSAVLRFNVRTDVALPADVTAQVTTSGLIGERFVALVPGPAGVQGEGGLLAAESTVIPSSGTADTQAIGNNFAKVADDLSSMTTTLRQVLGSPENAEKLQHIIDGLATFSEGLGNNSSTTLADIGRAANNFAKISDQLASGKGPLGELLMGTGSGGGAGGALGSLGDLGAAAKEFREVMAKINQGEGTLGKLVNDPQTADKLNNALDSFGEVSERVQQFRTEIALEGSTLTNESGVGKGNFSLTLQPRPTRFYVLGAESDGFASASRDMNGKYPAFAGRDFGGKTKFTAQFGEVFQDVAMGQDLAVRVGLKNNSGGVGFDTYGKLPYFDSDVKYSADIYDLGGS